MSRRVSLPTVVAVFTYVDHFRCPPACRRMRPAFAHAPLALVVALPVLSAVPTVPAAAQEDTTLRVLLFYKTQFHASHVEARQAVRDLATDLDVQYGQTVEIEETDNPGAFNTADLATHDAVVFAQTGGVLFNPEHSAPHLRRTSAAAAATWASTTPGGRSARASTMRTSSTAGSSAPSRKATQRTPPFGRAW